MKKLVVIKITNYTICLILYLKRWHQNYPTILWVVKEVPLYCNPSHLIHCLRVSFFFFFFFYSGILITGAKTTFCHGLVCDLVDAAKCCKLEADCASILNPEDFCHDSGGNGLISTIFIFIICTN